MSPFLFLAFA